MRIAICTDQYLPLLSGIADSIDILARELEKRGDAVRIYAPQMKGAEPSAMVMRLPTISINETAGISIVVPRGAMADIRAFNPDVIHAHTVGIAGLFGWRAARRLGVPLVGTDHTLPSYYLQYVGADIAPMRWLVRKISALYYQRCDAASAPSQMMLDELRAYGFSKPARVISNHIPTDLFRPLENRGALKEKLGIGKRAVLLFGRIAIEKNPQVALDAFARLPSDVQLVVVGDGPYRARFEQEMRERGIESRVRLLGVLRGKPLVEAIDACDAFLIASKSETQSMTTMQAMACEIPVVAARAGGLPEYVHDNENGFLCDADDAARFADRLQKLLDDEALAKKIGAAGRASVLPFSPENTCAQFEALYAEAMQGKSYAIKTA